MNDSITGLIKIVLVHVASAYFEDASINIKSRKKYNKNIEYYLDEFMYLSICVCTVCF